MNDINDVIYQIPSLTFDQLSKEGAGLKKIILVVEKSKYSTMESATLQLIIKAIKLDFEKDIILLKIDDHEKVSLSSLINDYQDILIFGLSPSVLGFFIEYKAYHILQFEKKRMLVADSLQELNVSKSKKGLLWSTLQNMYQV
ncbi:MAG: hypothetical protein WAT22_05550 [Saprospiraceae bacterium]|jgi:hypothetical protein|nr:hypothetical protein [Saprospiraceae bacterium]MBP6447825.1 hypothetical protein [Saprospiraceae bacterium]